MQKINEAVVRRLEYSRKVFAEAAKKKKGDNKKNKASAGCNHGGRKEVANQDKEDEEDVNGMIRAFIDCVGTIHAVPIEGTDQVGR